MEFLVLIIAVMLYFWIVVPLLKRKIGYRRVEQRHVFYDYKTKWQFVYEIAVIIICIILLFILTPVLQDYSVLFVPVAFVAILVVRGLLERQYHPSDKHHIISFVHASTIAIAFVAVIVYGLIIG